MIEVQELSKAFTDDQERPLWAVDRVSFSVGAGQVFGLLGPNGAGKTTTLRMLATLLKPTGGTATIAGYDLVTQPEQVRKTIGFISASTGVYERMTAWEIVDYFGRLNGMKGEPLRQRMELLFDRLQMQSLRDVLGGKMSTGMKQKTSIARALVHDPPVLVFDEATSGLDVMVARNLLETVLQLKAQGKCIVFSTHIMTEVQKLCDQVGIIYQGKILALGSLDELRQQYERNDVEDLFFDLISAYDRQMAAAETTS